VLPAWTTAPPSAIGATNPSQFLVLLGEITFQPAAYKGARSAPLILTLSTPTNFWRLPDLLVIRPERRIAASHEQ